MPTCLFLASCPPRCMPHAPTTLLTALCPTTLFNHQRCLCSNIYSLAVMVRLPAFWLSVALSCCFASLLGFTISTLGASSHISITTLAINSPNFVRHYTSFEPAGRLFMAPLQYACHPKCGKSYAKSGYLKQHQDHCDVWKVAQEKIHQRRRLLAQKAGPSTLVCHALIAYYLP